LFDSGMLVVGYEGGHHVQYWIIRCYQILGVAKKNEKDEIVKAAIDVKIARKRHT